MKLVHRDHRKRFQQEIYRDDETDLYYELFRERMDDHVEIYIGHGIRTKTIVFYDKHGSQTTLKCSVEDEYSQAFPIRTRERWSHLVSQIPNYVMRTML